MIGADQLAAARTRAATTLVDTCVITRPGTGTFTPGTGIIAGDGTTVYSGPCSIGPAASSDRTETGGDDRFLDARILRVPTTATGIVNGDQVTITGRPDLPDAFTVRQDMGRTTEVLRRIRVVSEGDAEAVPQ